MSEERDIEAVFEEFFPDEAELERQIKEEWDRLHARGETIRVGDASSNTYFRWMMQHGLDFFGILRRRGWIPDEDEE